LGLSGRSPVHLRSGQAQRCISVKHLIEPQIYPSAMFCSVSIHPHLAVLYASMVLPYEYHGLSDYASETLRALLGGE
jgi:hypothetical protein